MKDEGKLIEEIIRICQNPIIEMYQKKIQDIEKSYKAEIKHWRFSFMSCFVALLLVSAIAIIAILKIIK